MSGGSIDYVWLIFRGAAVTIQLTIFGCILGFVVAIVSGIALLSGKTAIRVAVRLYVEIFRGTSIFVQLFFAFFVLPVAVGIAISPIQAGVLAIGLNGGAYGAEIVRSALLAVSKDQREAAVALNLTWWQTLRHVTLPQAMVIMLPSFGNASIETMKSTAAASLITVPDLTFQAQMVRAQTGDTALPFAVILVTYLLIASGLTAFTGWLERYFNRGIVDVKR